MQNHCFHGNARSVIYSDCVCILSYLAQKVNVSYYFVTCGLSVFFHNIVKKHYFQGKHMECKMCVLIFSSTFDRNISHSKENSLRCYHKCTYAFT
jgi:hypothetical protein